MNEFVKAAPCFELNDLAEINLPNCGIDVAFRLLQDAFVPRPVFLVSTLSTGGTNNVAPFSYISPCTTIPAAVVISVLKRNDGSDKDTLVNLRSSGEFVINAVTWEIVEAANACAESLPPGISEFDTTGLTPVFLSCPTAHVAQSPVRLECRVESETRLGGDGAGAGSIVVASIVRAYVNKGVYRGDGKIDIAALRLIGRSSVDQYLIADDLFTIARPETGDPSV
jgi:flavin reductase (DIM6/NTAB) family NADH-FMN oxidoreductase RutF